LAMMETRSHRRRKLAAATAASSRRSSKSGISEIVGSMLMVLVVVAMSAVVFAFATNGFSGMGANFSSLFGSSANALNERIVVEQVTFNESGTRLGANLYVRNVGINPSNIVAIYVSNVTASSFVLSYTISPARQILSGSFQIIAVTFTPDVGTTYSFTIATQLGNTVIVNAKA
jgi:hypothetical protein